MQTHSAISNIFSNDSIKEGPQHIESLFNLLIPQNSEFRVIEYIKVLETSFGKLNASKRQLMSFYKGFFYQKAANLESNDNEKQILYKTALFNYDAFLREKTGPSDIQYYAQWQAGLLQESLHYPWFQIQDTLLKARSLDPIRAEAHTKLIRYHLSKSNWPQAYVFNSFSKEYYYNNSPEHIRKWQIDPSCYSWRVLDKQLLICSMLNIQGEIERTKTDITIYFDTNKENLPADEFNYIKHKLNSWRTKDHLEPI